MGRSWLAEEREAARRQAEGDETAKIRLALAWTRIYDLADAMAQALSEHQCPDCRCDCHTVLKRWDQLHAGEQFDGLEGGSDGC